jgi:hypothetical protein
LVTTIQEFDLALDLAEFLQAGGDALRRPALRGAARSALATAEKLLAPAIVYDWFPVGRRDGATVEVGGVVFRLGRHADLLRPAHLVLVGVVTIGPRLEARGRELQAQGKALASFMLDQAGVFAVGKLIEKARSIAEQYAAERGWGVGAELAPGQLSGWDVAEQKLVARLLDIESVGVRLTDSGMFVPEKSASIMVGVGPDYPSARVCSPCEYCAVSETCRYRH